MPTTRFSKIKWGTGLTVTPDPDDPAVIQVDGTGGPAGATGATGPTGATGATGAAGPGVPTGGTTGQALEKASGTDYDTHWVTLTSGGAPTGAAGGALDGTYPNPGIAASVAGAGLSEASDVLSVNVDGTTLAIASDTLKVNTDGNAAHYLDGSGHWSAPAGTTPAKQLRAQYFGQMPTSLPSSSLMYRVPYFAGSSVTFTLTRATLHLETAGSTTTTLLLEKAAPSAGVFIAVLVANLILTSSSTDAAVTSSLGSLNSGDLIRWRWLGLGTGAQSFYAQLEGNV